MNTHKLKTVDIKGKPYVPVNERLKYFREHFEGYALISEIIKMDSEQCVIKATVINDGGHPVATGIAWEERQAKGSFVNATSYVENCETSAWGRALANFGIGIDDSVSSADELIIATVDTKPEYVVEDSQADDQITEHGVEVMLELADNMLAFSNRNVFRDWVLLCTSVQLGSLTRETGLKMYNFLSKNQDVSTWPAKYIQALTEATKTNSPTADING